MINTIVDVAIQPSLTVILNWAENPQRLMVGFRRV
jgi:hypothetical protein